ncbi:MAG: heparinase II/III family protein, partial [Planctomycetes bacterium]|nr:heparinase II/III family protein [Planctomycetota bacterium]
SDLSDAPDDVYLLFKSSPFGAWSHAYADQNTFYLHGFGEPLAICSGYYPWYGSEHHTQWTWQSKAHNSILVDGEGQVAGTRASRGKIDRCVTSEWFDYCRGDAIEAYGGRLTRCFRHVLYVKETDGPGWFVIADDVASSKAATFQWLLHALSQMAVDKETRTVMITGQEAHLQVSFLTPEYLVFDQTDQFEPAPEPSEARRSFPNQWHLSASTRSAQPHVGFLVVLEPYRTQMEMRSTCEVVEAPGWVAGRVQTSEGEVLVGLRQGDGGAAVDGVETDAAFFALQRRPEERVARVLICDGSFLKVDGKASVAWQACRTDVAELKW